MEKSPKSTLKYTEDGEKSMEKSGEKWRKVEKSGEKWRNAKLGFHYKIMNPQFFGHYPGFCKKTVALWWDPAWPKRYCLVLSTTSVILYISV